MRNKVLITGGSGKIGSHFIKSFSDQYEFRVFDLHPPKMQDASIEYFQGNLTDKEYLLKACENVDIVIHLGGIANPDATFDDLLDANIIGTKNIIDAAIAAGCKKIIYASSAQTIEGYPKDIQLNTEMPIKPGNLYGVSNTYKRLDIQKTKLLTGYDPQYNSFDLFKLKK